MECEIVIALWVKTFATEKQFGYLLFVFSHWNLRATRVGTYFVMFPAVFLCLEHCLRIVGTQ